MKRGTWFLSNASLACPKAQLLVNGPTVNYLAT